MGGLRPVAFSRGFGFVGVVFQPFGGGGGILDELFGHCAAQPGENNIGKQRLVKGSPLPVDEFRDIVHRNVGLNVVVFEQIDCLFPASVCRAENKPLGPILRYKVRGFPF